MKKSILTLLAISNAALNLIIPSEAKAGSYGCYVYEHDNFGGASAKLEQNTTYSNLGNSWNDKITSLRVIGPYKLIVYQHANFTGESKTYFGDSSNIGSLWNDQISSVKCVRQ